MSINQCEPESALSTLRLLEQIHSLLATNDIAMAGGIRALTKLVDSAIPLPPTIALPLRVIRDRLRAAEKLSALRSELLAIVEITVAGAHATAPGDFPECVAVGRDPKFDCSGVLLNRDWVLTAAHCDDADTMFVGIDVNMPAAGRKYSIQHPGKVSGFLRLYKINDSNKPSVKKLTLGSDCEFKNGTRFVVAGFGGTNLMSNRGRQRCAWFRFIEPGGVTGMSETVKGDGVWQSGICPGDSGGPMEVFESSGEKILIGVTEERGSANCQSGGLFTHIRPQDAKWIEVVTGETFRRACP